MATLPTIDYDEIIYEPFVDSAQTLASKLREDHVRVFNKNFKNFNLKIYLFALLER